MLFKKHTRKLVALSAILALLLGLPACGNQGGTAEGGSSGTAVQGGDPFEAFMNALDTGYSSEVDEAISQMGDDPVYGFRGGASPSEYETTDYVKAEMEKIGLENVTVDETTVDGWTFKGANLTFTDADGAEAKIDLGGYQTTLQAEDVKVKVIYLGKATAKDYEGVDAEGKLVLLDIDQNEEWWINMPTYQAHVKGAMAVLANSAMPVEMPERVGTQDICGPDYAPAFGISQKDTDTLKAAIEAAGGELEVTFNADSKVTLDTTGTNVWGEIPGRTDEVIYMFAHRDGYFHSYFDDASGVGLCLGVAKAIIDSGYEPERTIRIVLHGSEEWGRTNSQCDWGIGAYEQIVNVHPEWAEKGYAIINIDGAYCVEGETTFGIAVGEELAAFAQEVADPLIQDSVYTYRYLTPPSTYKEDINYTRAGIPSIGTAKGEETIFYDTGYHTSADDKELMGFDEDTWTWMHKLYGRYVFAFDQTAVRPMDFSARFAALRDSYNEEIVQDDELFAKIDAAVAAGEEAAAVVSSMNDAYDAAVESGDAEKAASLRDEAIAYNTKLYEYYKLVQDELLWFDGEMGIVFPHEVRQSNIENLNGALAALEEGDAVTAYDEYLSGIDNGWNAQFFDKETVDFFNASIKETLKRTWVEDKYDMDGCYVDEVVRSLMKKADGGSADFTDETAELEKLLEQQQEYLAATLESEKESMDKLAEAIAELL